MAAASGMQLWAAEQGLGGMADPTPYAGPKGQPAGGGVAMPQTGPVAYNPGQFGAAFDTGGQAPFLAPGQAETFFQQNQGGFTQPSAASQYWAGLQGINAQGPPKGSNRAEEAYQSFQSQTPQDMSSFYDRAVQDATNNIDTSMASRGLFGSTAGANASANAIGGIRAGQAKDEAAYGMQRAGMAGTLGAGADASSRANNANDLAFYTGMAGIAGQADTARLQGLQSGMNAAAGAQQAMANRGQNFFNNTFDTSNALAGIETGIGLPQLQADQQSFDAAQQAYLAPYTEAYRQKQAGKQESEQGIASVFSMAKGGGMF